MAQLPAVLLDGLSSGLSLFLLSVGLWTSLSLRRPLDLAPAAFAAAGVVLAPPFAARLGSVAALPPTAQAVLGALLAIVAVALAARLVDALVLRRLQARATTDQAVASFALLAIAGLWLLPAGSGDMAAGAAATDGSAAARPWLQAAALVAVIGLLLRERTHAGRRRQALRRDPAAGPVLGIDARRLAANGFVTGAALAALGGLLAAGPFPSGPVLPGMAAPGLLAPGLAASPIGTLGLLLAVAAIGRGGSLHALLAIALLTGLAGAALAAFLPDVASLAIAVASLVLVMTFGRSAEPEPRP